MKKKQTAKVGNKINVKSSTWSFGNDVYKTFDDHIKSSIPIYEWAHELGIELSDFFLNKNSNVLDIGCSTGTFIKKINQRHFNKNLKIIGIDIEKNMIKAAKKNNKSYKNTKFYENNILDMKGTNFDLISSYFTFSFLRPRIRQNAYNKVYKSLNWGGGFIIFEKVRAPDARFQDMMTQVYNEFKLKNQFTPEEIINKSKSLKGVLEPFSSNENIRFLKRAGFKDVMTIFKYITFEGVLAIK